MSDAGKRWRLLVHKKAGKVYSPSVSVRSHHHRDRLVSKFSQDIELPGTHFDELVVGNWIHIEEMSANFWWMSIGGVTVHVKADRAGNPMMVTVDGPGDYDDAVAGCKYRCTWSRPDDETNR